MRNRRSVLLYITPEVRALINLLNPRAVIRPHGKSSNSWVSLPEPKPPKRTLGYDCYEMASQWRITPEAAMQRMTDEGWVFQEYDPIYGTARYTPPKPAT